MIAADIDVAVGPVRAALLAAAHRDATRIVEAATADADRVIDAARERAERISADARSQGENDARSAIATARASARRRAYGAELAARREAYDNLRTQARPAVAALRADPVYADALRQLVQRVRRVLGPDAQLRDGVDGGVMGEESGRRVDFSLARFADRAVDAVAATNEEQGWSTESSAGSADR